ncbi:primase-helicase family protein [Vreelandella sp. EE24]
MEAANDAGEPLPIAPSLECGTSDNGQGQDGALTHAQEGQEEVSQYGVRIRKDDMLTHFRLIYGTDLIWDGMRGRLIRVPHVREAVGRESFKEWQDHPWRMIAEEVVFDPTEMVDPRLNVNLYDGFKMVPDVRGADGCELIRAHIYRLCGQRDAEFWWLMKWMALPLQQPGTKMASAVLVHGAEGTGKSLLFEGILKRIYGEYGVTIGQAQLESQFTGWQSRRLFALAEEVVSRAEKAHYKGVLKHVVTGDELQINEKNMPLRSEQNHVNFVFLSNSTVPLELDLGDRRYFVLHVEDVPPPDYFERLSDEMAKGGVEAFYHYLLNLPLGDFKPHTKPPLSDAKQRLIDSSLSPARYFIYEWRNGDIPDLPYGVVAIPDLWKAFLRWCENTNEFKTKQRWFCDEVARDMLRDRRDIRYPSSSGDFKTTRLFVPPEYADKIGKKGWPDIAGDQARQFRFRVEVKSEGAGA